MTAKLGVPSLEFSQKVGFQAAAARHTLDRVLNRVLDSYTSMPTAFCFTYFLVTSWAHHFIYVFLMEGAGSQAMFRGLGGFIGNSLLTGQLVQCSSYGLALLGSPYPCHPGCWGPPGSNPEVLKEACGDGTKTQTY